MRNLLLRRRFASRRQSVWHRRQTLAQQTVTFLCAAPAGHVCQFAVQTGGSQVAFALPSGQRKEVPGITPHADKYCVCDPGPVTANCQAPRLDHWCLGATPSERLQRAQCALRSRSRVLDMRSLTPVLRVGYTDGWVQPHASSQIALGRFVSAMTAVRK
jgi:hypothetical protein